MHHHQAALVGDQINCAVHRAVSADYPHQHIPILTCSCGELLQWGQIVKWRNKEPAPVQNWYCPTCNVERAIPTFLEVMGNYHAALFGEKDEC